MSLIIDGYNLLHASGILGRGIGPGGLERSRRALLNFLVESLTDAELAQATVVFDAVHAPPGLPRRVTHRGLAVRFSDAPGCADTTIEGLIAEDSAPRRLVVVSSDHRLHRAARRRRAMAVDSDRWMADLLAARRERRAVSDDAPAKPVGELSAREVNYWLAQFDVELPAEEQSTDRAESDSESESLHPFPPGYMEEIEKMFDE